MKTRLHSFLMTLVLLAIGGGVASAAPIVWTNTANGNWNATTNWSPNQLPVAADDVFITNNGSYTVTVNVAATVGSLTLGGASGTQTLAVNQTLTLNGASLVDTNGVLNLTGGTVTGGGDLTVGGQFNWVSGTLSGAGLMTIATNGSVLMGTGSNKTLTGKTLVNLGSILYTNNTFYVQGGAVISNAPSGTFDITFDATIQNFSSEQLINAGLLRKTGGTNSMLLGIQFINSGTVLVQSGTLQTRGATTNIGTISISAGATLFLDSNPILMAGDTVLNGGGTVLTQNGTITFTNNYTITNVILNLAGDTVNFNSDATLWPSEFDLSGGTVGGSGNLIINAPFNWTSGGFTGSGSVTVNSNLLIAATGQVSVRGRTLINAGSAVYTNGTFALQLSGAFSNAPGAAFDIGFDGNVIGDTSTRFDNAGTLRKTAGTNTSTISGFFNNSGVVQAQAATLSFTGSGTNTGSFAVSNSATLNLGFNSATILMAGGSTISGAGNFSVGGGTVNLNGTLGVDGSSSFSSGTANFNGSYNITGGALNIANGTVNFNGTGTVSPAAVNLSGGTLGGTNSVTVNGPIYWTGGIMSGSGAVTANGGLIFGGNSHMQISGRTLINTASAVYTNGDFDLLSGSAFSNAPGATFDIAIDGYITGSSGTPFFNAGLLRKTAGTGIANIGAAFTNSGTVEIQSGTLSFNGSVCIQTAGLTFLNGGNFSPSTPFQLLGGTLAGSGLITGNVTNNGVVSPGADSPGQLIINGRYVQTVNGALDIELAGTSPGATYDQLIVSNAATLAGAMNVTFTNGFVPADGDQFAVLTCTGETGQFTPLSLPALSYPLIWNPVYAASSLTLTAQSFVLASPGAPTNGQTHLHFTGPAASSAVLESSTNLKTTNWIFIATNTPFTGTFDFIDTQATNPVKFYRVLVQP